MVGGDSLVVQTDRESSIMERVDDSLAVSAEHRRKQKIRTGTSINFVDALTFGGKCESRSEQDRLVYIAPVVLSRVRGKLSSRAF